MDPREIVDIVIVCVLCFISVAALAIVINRAFFILKADISAYNSVEELERALTRYMHILATIAANAPYVGLLGTVVGIMVTFSVISVDGSDVAGVMKGLSSALFATGFGLVVAIPSVLAYNVLLRGIKNRIVDWKSKYGR
ncbi:MAG: MotA/TolQ/ExbB proton channel family protein [Campylobacteraceae bacterium]|jgi:biopolymer transport protein ExbB|nr:MotA/TolQ/ExbB proton channel family protein [Campylobacteraceae bacterium]